MAAIVKAMCTAPRIPDRLVVLTFDDAVSNHASFVAPILRRYGFGATFFVCEFPPDFATNRQQYMTWEQIRSLSDAGFEIGNHTLTHANITELDEAGLSREITALEERCARHGIPRPTSFCYPGCHVTSASLPVIERHGYRLARIGDGRAYDPAADHPLLIPSFPCHGEDPALFHDAIAQARDGRVAVLMFHGVPEFTHPWVNTPPALFENYMRTLADGGYTVIALRDLAQSAALPLTERPGPSKPWAPLS